MKNVLITAIYPAPYRVELINEISKQYQTDVFFESSNGDFRDEKWFAKDQYFLLDTTIGREKFKHCVRNISQYSLVIFYDYTTKESIKLITICKLKKIPYILNADGVMLTTHGNWFREILKRFLIKDATGYFASGEHAKKYFMKYGAKEENIFNHTFSTLHKDDVLNILPDNDKIQNTRKELGIPINAKVAIAVGRFIPLKRFDVLINAWSKMPSNFYLVVIGGGPEEHRYRSLISDKGLSNVAIKGFHEKEKLQKYYMCADVLVHPTSYDVWGLIINEALACGLPVIVSEHCIAGLELIKQGLNGFIFSLYDDSEMCNYIKEILENDELRIRMKENTLKSIREYTIENMANIQIKAVTRILENG